MIISVLSQKGGVGKSTVSRALAVVFSQSDWRVHIADMDWQQQTSLSWSERRLSRGTRDSISVETYDSVDNALKSEAGCDVLVVDGRPASDRDSILFAKKSNLIVLPTGSGLDDLLPQLNLANDLVANGVDASKIIFIIGSITSDADAKSAKMTVAEWGYSCIDDHIKLRTAYSQAHDGGFSIVETRYESLNDAAMKPISKIAELAIGGNDE